MSARWMTLFVWAAVAASALFWGFRLWARPSAVPSQTQVAESNVMPRGDLTRLLGADAPVVVAATPEPAADSRFNLVGVVSPRAPQAAREGLALIAVDGKPPKTFRVGAVVEGQNVLKSVNARGATLGPQDGAATIALNIAPPPAAATGTLPAAGGFVPPARVPVIPPPIQPPIPPQIQQAPAMPQGQPLPPPPFQQQGVPPQSRDGSMK